MKTNNNQTIVTGVRRPIYEIAKDIREHWKNVYFGAEPYLKAMSKLNNINDYYIMVPAKYIINYFLCNAQTWRGEDARRIKKELKELVSSTNR